MRQEGLFEGQAKGKETLHVGQIDDMDVSWVKGTRVGGNETPGHHYAERSYSVPEGVLKAGGNVIAVRVMDHGWSGGIVGNPKQLALAWKNRRLSLANAWRYAAGAPIWKLKEVRHGAKRAVRERKKLFRGVIGSSGRVGLGMGAWSRLDAASITKESRLGLRSGVPSAG